jgi:hypothetical protein
MRPKLESTRVKPWAQQINCAGAVVAMSFQFQSHKLHFCGKYFPEKKVA